MELKGHVAKQMSRDAHTGHPHFSKMKKQVLWLLLAVVATLLLGGVLFVPGYSEVLLHKTGLFPTQTLTATPTNRPAPTRTLTFTPTSTSAPTVSPTPTLTPTSEPVAGPPARVRLYASAITEKGKRLRQALQDLGETLQAPQLTDRDWKRDVAAQVTDIRLIHQELAAMDVPIEMIGFHSALLDASFDCDEAMFFLNNVDTINLSDVKVAGRLMRSCSDRFFSRAATLDEYMEQ